MNASSSKNASFDSAREHVGKVYAKGLVGAADAQQVTDQVLAELDSLVDDVLQSLGDFEALLASPRISVEDKVRILDSAFAGRMTPLLLTFLKVVARHGRLDCLRQIRSAARRLYNELRGRVAVAIQTAEPLTDELLGQIQQGLTAALGRQIDLDCRVEPELLGGLVVRVGDTVFDGSLDNRLEKMRSDTLDITTQMIRDSLPRFLVSES